MNKYLLLFRISRTLMRSFDFKRNLNVLIMGAQSAVGRDLAFLLKQNSLISQLRLYDDSLIEDSLELIDTECAVKKFIGKDSISGAMSGSNVIVLTSSDFVPSSDDELFDANKTTVAEWTSAYARYCSNAILCVACHPLNMLVPLACEILKDRKVDYSKRVLGVTTFDLLKATHIVSKLKDKNISRLFIPVVCGSSSDTAVPLLSQTSPPCMYEQNEIEQITEAVRDKNVNSSFHLSFSYAVARFVTSVMLALKGEHGIIDCAFIDSAETEAGYFASPVLFDNHGIRKDLGIGKITDFEAGLIRSSIVPLLKDIKKGTDYASSFLMKE